MKNVLLVNNDQAMLSLIAGLLKSQGAFFTVHAARHSRHDFLSLKDIPFDLVITTVNFFGVECSKLIRQLSRENPSIKIIILTRGTSLRTQASIKRFPSAIHLDQSFDLNLLPQRVFTELGIDYGGRIRGITITSFLQMMELESCTCNLKVSSKNMSGLLWLKNGKLIAARSQSREGKEAALDIIARKSVSIDINYASHDVGEQFSIPLMNLILEGGQRHDEFMSRIENKREHERYDILVTTDYHLDNIKRQCVLCDISLGGAYVIIEQEIELGEMITLDLTSPTVKSKCSIEATIVRKDGMGAGVSFHIKSPEQQQVIESIIDSSSKIVQQQVMQAPAEEH